MTTQHGFERAKSGYEPTIRTDPTRQTEIDRQREFDKGMMMKAITLALLNFYKEKYNIEFDEKAKRECVDSIALSMSAQTRHHNEDEKSSEDAEEDRLHKYAMKNIIKEYAMENIIAVEKMLEGDGHLSHLRTSQGGLKAQVNEEAFDNIADLAVLFYNQLQAQHQHPSPR